MNSKKRWVEPEIFRCIVKYAPLVSIDIIVENQEGKFLLGLRKNRPAKGYWFVPGGRVFKGETLAEAFKNITEKELDIELDICNAEFLGVFEHFYNDSFFGDDIETHYIVNAFKVKVDNTDLKPDNQHECFRWFSKEEILKNERVHPYCRLYFNSSVNG